MTMTTTVTSDDVRRAMTKLMTVSGKRAAAERQAGTVWNEYLREPANGVRRAVSDRAEAEAAALRTEWFATFGELQDLIRALDLPSDADLHPTVEQLLADGWTVDAAFAHVEGTCDRTICSHRSHYTDR